MERQSYAVEGVTPHALTCFCSTNVVNCTMLPIVRRSQGAISMLVRSVHVMASFPSSVVRDCHMRLHNNNKNRTTLNVQAFNRALQLPDSDLHPLGIIATYLP
jgi:hypothetical protein